MPTWWVTATVDKDTQELALEADSEGHALALISGKPVDYWQTFFPSVRDTREVAITDLESQAARDHAVLMQQEHEAAEARRKAEEEEASKPKKRGRKKKN